MNEHEVPQVSTATIVYPNKYPARPKMIIYPPREQSAVPVGTVAQPTTLGVCNEVEGKSWFDANSPDYVGADFFERTSLDKHVSMQDLPEIATTEANNSDEAETKGTSCSHTRVSKPTTPGVNDKYEYLNKLKLIGPEITDGLSRRQKRRQHVYKPKDI